MPARSTAKCFMVLPESCSTPSKGRASATNAGSRESRKSLSHIDLEDAIVSAGNEPVLRAGHLRLGSGTSEASFNLSARRAPRYEAIRTSRCDRCLPEGAA